MFPLRPLQITLNQQSIDMLSRLQSKKGDTLTWFDHFSEARALHTICITLLKPEVKIKTRFLTGNVRLRGTGPGFLVGRLMYCSLENIYYSFVIHCFFVNHIFFNSYVLHCTLAAHLILAISCYYWKYS